MSHKTRFARVLTISIVAAFVLPAAFVPLASAQGNISGAGSALTSAPQKSVGVFDVAPGAAPGEGKATGAVTQAVIAEGSGAAGGSAGTGVIKDFGISSAGAEASQIFSSIDIPGFTPTSRLEGVGTSALTLKSASMVVGLTDTSSSLLTFKNTGSTDQQVVLNAASDVIITPTSAASNVWEVKGSGTSGALVLIGAKGENAIQKGSKLELSSNAKKATATLKQGTQLLYRANSDYAQGGAAEADQSVADYNEVAVEALATGKLAGEATSEFATGASVVAQYNYYATATLRSEARIAGRVTSELRTAADVCTSLSGAGSGAGSAAGSAPGATGSGSGSAAASAQAQACANLNQVVAYDLDYVDVAAQTSEQVVVYGNGQLMQRVDAAADVAARADTYWATAVEGRVLVLTSVAAKASAVTQITIAAIAQGEAAADTLAELDAQSQVTTQLQGGFQLLGNLDASAQGSGQVIGTFGSFFASEAKGDAAARDYTDVRTSTEIFSKIEFAADAAADATAEFTSTAKAGAAGAATSSTSTANRASVSMVTKVGGEVVARAEFTDSVYATILATAEASTLADFHLANDVDARFVSDAENVVALEGPAGEIGHMILMRADGSAVSSTRFDLTQANSVKARLEENERIVFRGATEAQTKASAEAAANAIAQGSLASETSVGFVANAIASTDVNYQTHVKQSIRTAADATHKGLVTLQVVNDAAASAKATATILVADRATLAAQTAADIAVTVDGKAAAAASSAAEVFAAAQAAPSASAQALYYVTTSLQGQTQVITSIPNLAARTTSTIVVTSTADVAAKAASALDVFGSFQPGYGGVADGSVVDLIAKPEAGLLLDYTVTAKSQVEGAAEKTTTVFDAVKVGDSAFAAGSASTANSLRFTSDQAVVEAFDVSSATMKVLATADMVTKLDLGSNIQATKVSENVVFLKAPDFSGAIILTKAATANAGANTASKLDLSQAAAAGGIVTAQLRSGSQVVFKAFSGFEAELSEAEQRAHAEAIAKGTLLGHVIVDTVQGATATTTSTANINYYSDVKAVTSVASADKIEVLVDSASSMGKTIVISLDRDTVRGLIDGDAKLLVDGQEIPQISGEGAYQKVLGSSTDAFTILTTQGEVGLQAIVTLGHFSTRSISVETPESIWGNWFVWSTLGLGAVVAGQFTYPRLRRK